jgi:hypothetical protein
VAHQSAGQPIRQSRVGEWEFCGRAALTGDGASYTFGLDAKDPKFWHGGLSVIAGMIDELEGMN